MTLRTKNFIMNGTTGICTLIFVLHILILYFFPETRNPESIIIFCNTVLILTASVILQLLYQKSLPTEIILFAVYLLSFALQSVRLSPYVLNLDTAVVRLIIGRLSLFFKYIALLALMGSSLFSYIIKKQKVGTWVLSITFSSLIMVSLLHFNTGIVNHNLIPKIIFSTEELVLTLSIILITTISFIKSGIDSKNSEYFYMAGASASLSMAITLSFISLNIITEVIIAIFLITGTFFYLRSMYNITLWG